MTSMLFEPPVRRSAWNAEAALHDCVTFRVESPRGVVGYVEDVPLDDWGVNVAGLVVYGDQERWFVPVEDVAWVDADRELVRVRRTP
jgi:hypothetical protein